MQVLASSFPDPLGRRPFPLKANTTILTIGNSHTRQLMKTLVCQYSDEIQAVDMSMGFNSKRSDSFEVTFGNNSTLIVLTDNPLVYSTKWVDLLESGIQRKLSELDGIVVGKFNSFEESKEGTTFIKTIESLTRNMPSVDFSKIPPPSLQAFADAYKGPLIYVSMFAAYGKYAFRNATVTMQREKKRGRKNIALVDGRKYIEMMGIECGTDSYSKMKKCHEKGTKSNRPAEQMNRCIGNYGGHPDLIAWEIVEKLHALLSSSETPANTGTKVTKKPLTNKSNNF